MTKYCVKKTSQSQFLVQNC